MDKNDMGLHTLVNDTDTKWRLKIRNLKLEIGFDRNEHKLNRPNTNKKLAERPLEA